MPDGISPGDVLFVGGMVGALFSFAAGLTHVASGGNSLVAGLVYGLAALGGVVLAVAAVVAAALYASSSS
ncbi:hypothetical protein [Halocalculus aciditolerans]|nr:hypothetical protein [Halocalculus aciditolerans]